MHGKTKDSEQYTNQFADPKEFAAHACAFTGHRPNKFPWRYNEDSPGCVALKKTLAEQIAALADGGYTNFLSGMALGVDCWCSQIVLDLREKNPAMRLHCLLPCEGQDAKWPAASRERYHAILNRADSIVYVNRAYSDPEVIDPREFLDTVVNVRIPNPFLPDTPQRIATDTSQKIPIRFGETIRSYVERPDLDPAALTCVPLAIALWLRYLLAVDDDGSAFACSPDPMLEMLQSQLAGVGLGRPEGATDALLAPVLSNKVLFGVDLCEVGLAPKISSMFREMLTGKGAVRATLQSYLNHDGGMA